MKDSVSSSSNNLKQGIWPTTILQKNAIVILVHRFDPLLLICVTEALPADPTRQRARQRFPETVGAAGLVINGPEANEICRQGQASGVVTIGRRRPGADERYCGSRLIDGDDRGQ
jgi:hypothetical protein